ncbi:MAG: metallophosphoesterase, partial [Hafnia sp.]
MRVGCQSDHHLDYGHACLGDAYLEALKVPEVDVLIVAGDLAADHALVRKALVRFREYVENVIYVPGNHEHDDKDIQESRVALVSAADIPGVHLLDDGFVDINGVRFIGSTLWTDCGDAHKQALIGEFIFKYWPIKNGERYFSPADSTRLHHQMLDYLQFQLAEARRHDLIPVVITHQAPSKRSVSSRFLSSQVNE